MSQDFAEYVTGDLLPGLSEITARRMFSGYGVYQRDTMFGIIVRDTLYFKVDNRTRPLFEQRGSRPFRYRRKGKSVTLSSFWEVPADVLEDRAMLHEWVSRAVAVTRRNSRRTHSRSVRAS